MRTCMNNSCCGTSVHEAVGVVEGVVAGDMDGRTHSCHVGDVVLALPSNVSVAHVLAHALS